MGCVQDEYNEPRAASYDNCGYLRKSLAVAEAGLDLKTRELAYCKEDRDQLTNEIEYLEERLETAEAEIRRLESEPQSWREDAWRVKYEALEEELADCRAEYDDLLSHFRGE